MLQQSRSLVPLRRGLRPARALAWPAAALLVLAAVGPLIGADDDGPEEVLPLPRWTDSEWQALQGTRSSAPLLANPLLPTEMLAPEDLRESGSPLGDPVGNPELAKAPPQITPPSMDGLRADEMGLFLPESLLDQNKGHLTTRPEPTPAVALREVSPEFLKAASHSPSDRLLVDPDGLVQETQAEDLSRFLEFHARESRIKAYFLVLDRDQKLPSSPDLAGLASGALLSSDSCLAIYSLGEPWRTRLFMSRKVHDAASASYLSNLLEDCVHDAMQVSEPSDQLHRFAVRLSIRLNWLEKILDPPASGKVGASDPAANPATLSHALSEVGGPQESAAAVPFAGWLSHLGRAIQWTILSVAALLVLAGLLFLGWKWRQRWMLSRVWVLPEPQIEPRLGGAFSGGTGAWTRYR